MRRTLCRLAAQQRGIDTSSTPPLISIANATFYRQHPSTPASLELDDSLHGKPIDGNPPLFPGLNFTLPSFSEPKQHWTVLGNASAARTTFLQVLRGQHSCFPPTARAYPYLATDAIAHKDLRLRSPSHAIQYVGFDAERGRPGGSGMRGAYLSARYESRKEETDFSLQDFLLGNTELNADEQLLRHPDPALFGQVMDDLQLVPLKDMPVTHLSNGQTRRARIAKALLARPEVLLLDGPFMGLDPPTLQMLSALLRRLAEAQAPRLILSLKPDEHIPNWITHMAFVTKAFKLDSIGPIDQVTEHIHARSSDIRNSITGATFKPAGTQTKEEWGKAPETKDEDLEIVETSRHLRDHRPVLNTVSDSFLLSHRERAQSSRERNRLKKGDPEVDPAGTSGDRVAYVPGERHVQMSRDGFTPASMPHNPPGEALIEMKGVKVQYGGKAVLGDWKEVHDGAERSGLWWTISRGQRWGVFGPNGSGKTTLISLITSDHPQTYSLPVTLFGRSRLPSPGQPGISIFDIQSRIGHSSPEIHVFFPKYLSVRRAIESAWADTPLTRPRLTNDMDEKVSAALRWFQAELHPTFGPTEMQKQEMLRRTRFDRNFASEGKRAKSYLREEINIKLAEEDLDLHSTLEWADELKFGELSFSAQRVVLFIRAVIRNPDLVVLDEAFSGMDDFARDKCHLFLSRGESAIFSYRTGQPGKLIRQGSPRPYESDLSRAGRVRVHGLQQHQGLIVISHKKEEVPGCIRNWICLPEAGAGALPRTGELDAPLELGSHGWKEIWGETLRRRAKVQPPTPERQAERRLNRLRVREARQTAKELLSDDPAVAERAKRARDAAYRKEYFARPDPTGEAGTIYERRMKRRREQRALLKATETPEQKSQRLAEAKAKKKAHLASLTQDELAEHKARQSERYRSAKEKLSAEALERKKAAHREWHRERMRRKAVESPEELAERRKRLREKARLRYHSDAEFRERHLQRLRESRERMRLREAEAEAQARRDDVKAIGSKTTPKRQTKRKNKGPGSKRTKVGTSTSN